MSIFKHVLEDNWIEVEKEVDGYIDQIKKKTVRKEIKKFEKDKKAKSK